MRFILIVVNNISFLHKWREIISRSTKKSGILLPREKEEIDWIYSQIAFYSSELESQLKRDYNQLVLYTYTNRMLFLCLKKWSWTKDLIWSTFPHLWTENENRMEGNHLLKFSFCKREINSRRKSRFYTYFCQLFWKCSP